MKTFLPDCRRRIWLSIALLGLTATTLSAADFAQWRGPLRDGHSPETGLLPEWPKDGPKLLWQTTNALGGFSTPVAVGERIYLLGSEGTEESVLAFAVKDGSRVWAAKLGK